MGRRKKFITVILCLLIVLTLAFIWGNSFMDRTQSQEVSNGLLDNLRPFLALFGISPEDDHIFRKLAHFAEFGLLGTELSLLVLLHKGRCFKAFSYAALVSLFAAAADETIQFFTGRACQFSDVMLDFSGSICGILGIWVLSLLLDRR